MLARRAWAAAASGKADLVALNPGRDSAMASKRRPQLNTAVEQSRLSGDQVPASAPGSAPTASPLCQVGLGGQRGPQQAERQRGADLECDPAFFF